MVRQGDRRIAVEKAASGLTAAASASSVSKAAVRVAVDRQSGLTNWTSQIAGTRPGRAIAVVRDVTGDPVIADLARVNSITRAQPPTLAWQPVARARDYLVTLQSLPPAYQWEACSGAITPLRIALATEENVARQVTARQPSQTRQQRGLAHPITPQDADRFTRIDFKRQLPRNVCLTHL